MRRCSHSLLVGLLVFSLSIDAARACGHLRAWHHCPPATAVPIVIVVEGGWDWCGPVETVADCGCDEGAVVPACGDVSVCCGEVVIGAPLDACDSISVEVAAAVEPAHVVVGDSVLAPDPAPTLAPPPPVAEPVPAPAAPEPIVALPSLEPVEPVSASTPAVPADVDEPALEPAPALVPPTVPATRPVEPAPRNAFDEADAAGRAPNPEGLGPAVEPADAPEPAADAAAEPQAVREPLRRWIDDTASSAVVGRLVDLRGDRVEILRADGRTVTVPLDRLSVRDRGYVAAATPRIAAGRSRGPLPTDTAGR